MVRAAGNCGLWVVGIVTGVIFLFYIVTYLCEGLEDDWVDVIKSFSFFTVFFGLIGITIASFITATIKAALICLVITIITTFILPKDFELDLD